MRTLNSANAVQFPNRSPSPFTFPIGAFVNPFPTAPPIILNPLICSAKSGYFWNTKPTLVSVPVATSHAVPFGVPINALYMASKYPTSVASGTVGCGSRVTPSKPDSPGQSQCVVRDIVRIKLSNTVYIGCVDSVADDGLGRAGVDGDIALAYGFEDGEGVEGCLLEGCIAVDGGDA